MRWNDGFEFTTRIAAEFAGESVLGYLTRRYRHSSATEWADRISAGLVRIDSIAVAPDAVLQRGQTLIWRRPRWQEPAAPAAFVVLEEDEDFLAVAKPAGLPTLPGANFLATTLLNEVRKYAPGSAPVHRLGRWTSGVVLFGRTHAARASLSHQWAAGEVDKRYRALAAGSPERDAFTIEQPIGPVPHPLLGSVHAACAAGKAASSHVTVLERRSDSFLCEVRIATGRPHQIRIHLAAAGHPLLGDPLYEAGGVPRPDSRALPGDPGYQLHAGELSFRHPRLGHVVRIVCPPPAPLRTSAQAR